MSTKDGRLEGWEEIAGHLARGVRTAIRWERERGLPVHRVPAGQRGSVYAFRDEIDQWRSGNSPALVPSVGRERSKATGVVAVMATVLVAMGAIALISTAGRSRGLVAEGRLGRLDYGPREVVALAEAGEVAWRHEFPVPLHDRLAVSDSPRHAIADIDGDGHDEVVATVPLSVGTDGVQDELVCFSSPGEVIWHRTLEDTVTFRGGTFGPRGSSALRRTCT